MTSAIPSDWRSKPTITVEQAGQILGVGRSAAYAAARADELPAIRIGRRLVVPVGQLRKMLGEIRKDD